MMEALLFFGFAIAWTALWVVVERWETRDLDMPIEAAQLRDAPFEPIECARCEQEIVTPFMRGQVQNAWKRLLRRPYCAVICDHCHSIEGWESPPTDV